MANREVGREEVPLGRRPPGLSAAGVPLGPSWREPILAQGQAQPLAVAARLIQSSELSLHLAACPGAKH